MKLPRTLLAAFFATTCLVASAFAADVVGAWKWTVNTPNGEIETTLTIVSKDGQLSGTYSNSFGETAVSKIVVSDDTISFNVEREMGGNKFTLKYSGKISGDKIDGTIEAPGWDGGEARKLEWHAKREAAEAKK